MNSIWIIDPLNTDWLNWSISLNCESWSTNIEDLKQVNEETLCCFEKALLSNEEE